MQQVPVNPRTINTAQGNEKVDFGSLGMKPKVLLVGKFNAMEYIKVSEEQIMSLEDSQREIFEEQQMRAIIKQVVAYPRIPTYGGICMFPLQDIGNAACKDVGINVGVNTFNRGAFANNTITHLGAVTRRSFRKVFIETEIQVINPGAASTRHILKVPASVMQNLTLVGGQVPGGRIVPAVLQEGVVTYHLPELQDRFKGVQSWDTNSLHKVLAMQMKAYRDIDQESYYIKFHEMQLAAERGGCQRTFWTKVWLDFFRMQTVMKVGRNNVAVVAIQGYALPHDYYMDNDGVRRNGESPRRLRQIADNNEFFCNIGEGCHSARYRDFVLRYTGAWPPANITFNNAKIATDLHRSDCITIPGFGGVIFHLGHQPPFTQAPAAINLPSPQEILGFMSTHLKMTSTFADCHFGFEFAAQWVFGKSTGDLHGASPRGSRVGAGTANNDWFSYSQLEQTNRVSLPKDLTAVEYMRPFAQVKGGHSPIIDMILCRPNEIEHIAIRYALAVGHAYDVNKCFHNLNRHVVASHQFNAGDREQTHVSELFAKPMDVRLNRWNAHLLNASAWMFGFAPMISVLETKRHFDDFSTYTTAGPGAYQLDHDCRVHTVSLQLVEFIRAMPDLMTLPFEDGTIKWSEDLALPVDNTHDRIDRVRLSNSLPFSRGLMWQMDGGQMYSAQYYAARAVTEGQAPTIHKWDSPHQVNWPVNPVAVPQRMLPAPLNMFFRPGLMPTVDFNSMFNIAHGVRTGVVSREWTRIAMREQNLTTVVRPLANHSMVSESARSLGYDTLSYKTIPVARWDNLMVLQALVPPVGLPYYPSQTPEHAMGEGYRHGASPAFEANDTQIEQATQGVRAMVPKLMLEGFNRKNKLENSGYVAQKMSSAERNQRAKREKQTIARFNGQNAGKSVRESEAPAPEAQRPGKQERAQAKLEAEKRRDDNFQPQVPKGSGKNGHVQFSGEAKKRGYEKKREEWKKKEEAYAAKEAGNSDSEVELESKKARTEKPDDTRLQEMEEHKSNVAERNAAAQLARYAKGSDDNVRDIADTIGAAILGKVAVVVPENDEQLN